MLAVVRLSESTFMRRFAQQLGLPSGGYGRLVTRVLNIANRPLMAGSADALAAAPGSRVADIGFGGGYGLKILLDQVGEQGTVYGIDLSSTAIAQAQRAFRRPVDAGRLQLIQAPMKQLPIPDGGLDGVVTVNTIYYIPDSELRLSLAEVSRILRPGGRLVVGVGDPSYIATTPWRNGLINRPTTEVVGLIEEAGFGIQDHRRIGESDKAFHVYVAVSKPD
ncbi:class I SAM-dependent methyltransferase [Nocardia sp. NPDC050175]|uniref:class I SAM-dependent methyltransferase n=1 Tax=Nocardia sp. NPDC050175 TaxID=3364317 RepID=UPI0037ABFD1D